MVVQFVEFAVVNEHIAAIAVDVETVDVAVFQCGVAEVVGAENTPVGVGGETEEMAVPHVVHLDAVPIGVRPGVCAVDGDILKCNVRAVLDVDGGIGVEIFSVGGVDS